MDKRLAGLLGAAAALTSMASAQAAPAQPEFAPATSYRDLLDPVPNAVPVLKADDARLAQKATAGQVAEVTVIRHHHHHHHVVVVPPRRYHHHHHHSVIITH